MNLSMDEIHAGFDEMEAAIKTLRALNEETVLAGYPCGDRTVTLDNVRAMRCKIAELKQIIADLMACQPTPKYCAPDTLCDRPIACSNAGRCLKPKLRTITEADAIRMDQTDKWK